MKPFTLDPISAREAGTLTGLFLRRYARTPDAEAYRAFDPARAQWHSYTWREVEALAGRWQAALAGERLAPGDRVAVLAQNSVQWVCFDIAALGLGLVVVPLYTTDSAGNIAYILGNSGARLLLVGSVAQWSKLTPRRAEFPALERVLCLEDNAPEATADIQWRTLPQWLPGEASRLDERVSQPGALASIVYTSGTTGRPKGVMLSHANILANAESVLAQVSAYREDVFLSFLPLSHAFERTVGYYVPMMAGSCVAYARSVQLLPEDLVTVRPTLLVSVPRIYERAYSRIAHQLSGHRLLSVLFDLAVSVGWRRFEAGQGRSAKPGWLAAAAWWLLRRLVAKRVIDRFGGRLRLAVSGGAPLAARLARCFVGLGVPLLQGYGLTEASPVVTGNRVEDNVPESVGAALPGIELRLGANDELLVRGPNVMRGYWNNPEASRQALDADGWLHTGDKARIDAGRVYIVGRLKDILVLSTAEKVSPTDLELAIGEDPLFEQVMVVGEGMPYVAALLVLNADTWRDVAASLGVDPHDPRSLSASIVSSAVLRRIGERLAPFPVHARVRSVWLTLEPWTTEDGLITPTLKIKRQELEARFAREIAQLFPDRAAAR
jgi:long-chain acyl-CoA synthetase